MSKRTSPSANDGKPVGTPTEAKCAQEAGVTDAPPWQLKRLGIMLPKKEYRKAVARYMQKVGWQKNQDRQRARFNALAHREQDMSPRLKRNSGEST